MRKTRHFTFLLQVGCLMSALLPTQAQTSTTTQAAAPVPVFSLEQTIQAALQSSSDLQTAARNVEIDRQRADEAAAAGRPTLEASGSATRFDAATKVAFGAGPPVTFLNDHREVLQANLGEKVDLTGQIRAAKDQAQLQSLADQFILTQVRNARILRAKTLYFNLLRADHQVQVAQAALATAITQQKNAQQLYAGQIGQRIDLLRANTQVSTSQQSLASAINSRNLAQINFNDLVGRPLNQPVQVSDVPGVTVGYDVTNATTVGAATSQSQTPFTVAPNAVAAIDVDKSLATAFQTRPEILADQVNLRVAEVGVKLARSGLEPSLSFSATGNYFPTTSFQDIRKRTAAITATLSIPLYDGGATRDRVQEAHLRTANAQTTLDSEKSDVAIDVRQSYLNLATAASQIDAANTALQQAIAARQLAEVRYRGGVGLYLEVTDAQSALTQAENSQVNAVYDYLIARAQFENAVGAPQLR